jgi:POT family proton-dependent oligopeptide transporter
MNQEKPSRSKQIIRELTDPFIELTRTSRALTGVNISYIIEGFTYFGIIGLLTLFYNEYVGLTDVEAAWTVGLLTAGITFSQLLFGATVDWVGVRRALLWSILLILAGRVLLTGGYIFGGDSGLWSNNYIFTLMGIFAIVIGYGIYQPACYTAVKKFTTPANAAMGYAMLYALMNLGGFLPGIVSPVLRSGFTLEIESLNINFAFAGWGISGVFWFIVVATFIGFLAVFFIITNKAQKDAELIAANEKDGEEEEDEMADMSAREKLRYYIANFPLSDLRFLFFIFILIPVQTLFAHNWLTLPAYTSRAFEGFVGNNFEFFVNLNPIFIFVLTPVVTALTVKRDTYKMMIIGTFVMAAPTFILTIGPSIYTLMAYLVIMTIGEAMWQPRFLQWVAEIAPRNMTGIYMGIGQFPWFLTKWVTSLYSGWFLMNYIPADTPAEQMDSEYMWLIYGFIAIITPIALLLAKGWMQKGFKTKHEG